MKRRHPRAWAVAWLALLLMAWAGGVTLLTASGPVQARLLGWAMLSGGAVQGTLLLRLDRAAGNPFQAPGGAATRLTAGMVFVTALTITTAVWMVRQPAPPRLEHLIGQAAPAACRASLGSRRL